MHTKCGNLGAHHWQYIVDAFKKDFSTNRTIANIKTQRMNVMKLIGRTPSTWRWHKICNKIWRCIPKAARIPKAKENEKDVFYIRKVINLNDYDGKG